MENNTNWMTLKDKRNSISWFEKGAEEVRKNHEKQLQEALAKDTEALQALFKEFDDNDALTVRHCCTSEGGGYLSILSESGKKRFTPSAYRLELVGGAWSCYTWYRLYTAQLCLIDYLQQLQNAIADKAAVEIRLLYIGYIMRNLEADRERGIHDDFEIGFMLPKIEVFQRRFAKDVEKWMPTTTPERIKGGFGDWEDYYNENCKEYVFISELAHSMISKIYENRGALEQCGLWDKSHTAIRKVHLTAYDFTHDKHTLIERP